MSDEQEGQILDPRDSAAMERILSAARFGAVGRLADSVTHDLNNILGASIAYSELISIDEGIQGESRRMLAEIASGLLRGSALMNTLTTLTRADVQRAVAVDAAELARQALQLTGYVLKRSKIVIETYIPTVDVTIVADGPRIHVALLHLLNNAREALDSVPEMERRVKLSVTYTPTEATFHVWNAGPAIDEATQDKMFTPYFTTKPVPSLGLGLHASRLAGELHDGSLTYAPETGFSLRVNRYSAFAKKLREAQRGS